VLSLRSMSFRLALSNPNWCVVQSEFDALQAKRHLDLGTSSPGVNVVTGKWVYHHKFLLDGSLDRYKARRVLGGFTQQPEIDYDETLSPVVKPATNCVVLSLALSCSWSIHQLDIKNVFLHGTVTKTVYCVQPSGFVDSSRPDHVCHLNRSIYGLKQALTLGTVTSLLASHLLDLAKLSLTLHHLFTVVALIWLSCFSMLMTSFSRLHQRVSSSRLFWLFDMNSL
jgi:hypothetical protein